MDLQEPTKRMSTTSGTHQGTVELLDEPRRDREEVPVGRDGSGREIRRADDKPGITNLVDILRCRERVGHPRRSRSHVRRDGLRRLQARTSATLSRRCSARCVQRYLEMRADEGELRRLLALGADRARAASAPTLDEDVRADGFRAPHLIRASGSSPFARRRGGSAAPADRACRRSRRTSSSPVRRPETSSHRTRPRPARKGSSCGSTSLGTP